MCPKLGRPDLLLGGKSYLLTIGDWRSSTQKCTRFPKRFSPHRELKVRTMAASLRGKRERIDQGNTPYICYIIIKVLVVAKTASSLLFSCCDSTSVVATFHFALLFVILHSPTRFNSILSPLYYLITWLLVIEFIS